MRPRERLAPLEQSLLRVLFLYVITLGVYPAYWFVKNGPQLSRLTKKEPIQRNFTVVAVALSVASVGFDVLEGLNGKQRPDSGAHALEGLVALALFIMVQVLAFQVRRILEGYASRIRRPRRLSGLATFFFGPLYLQFAINRMHRELGLEPRDKSIRSVLARE